MTNGKLVSYEEFVKAWMSSTKVAEVMEKTGMKYADATSLATNLRKRGVNLPSFKSLRRQNVDVEGLNMLINTHK